LAKIADVIFAVTKPHPGHRLFRKDGGALFFFTPVSSIERFRFPSFVVPAPLPSRFGRPNC